MKFTSSLILLVPLIVLFYSCAIEQEKQVKERNLRRIFVGTYTREEGHVDGKAAGVYRVDLNQEGQIKQTITSAEVVNPSFVSIDSQLDYLYVVSETGADDGLEGGLFSFSVSGEGDLSLVDSVGSGGWYPCHVATNQSGDMVFAANYVGGVVAIYKSERGELSLLQELSFEGNGSHWRQDASHTHMSVLSPDEEFLFVVDLGSNVIWNFQWDLSSGLFVENERQVKLEMKEGDGPRHMDFHPEGNLAAVINELSNTVSLLSFSSQTGVLEVIETKSTISKADSAVSNATADIHFHPNGRFLYGSNRGQNTISVFEVLDGPKLKLIQEISTNGEVPRNFAISSDGAMLWVANQNSDNISFYSIDSDTGKLTYDNQLENIMTPVCVTGL